MDAFQNQKPDKSIGTPSGREPESPLSAARSSVSKAFKRDGSTSDNTGKNSKSRKRTKQIVEVVEAIPLEKPANPEDMEENEKVRNDIPRLRKLE